MDAYGYLQAASYSHCPQCGQPAVGGQLLCGHPIPPQPRLRPKLQILFGGMARAYDQSEADALYAAMEERIAGLEEHKQSVRSLTRMLDVALHGADAAPQASLCDLVGPARDLRAKLDALEAKVQELAAANARQEADYEQACSDLLACKEGADRAIAIGLELCRHIAQLKATQRQPSGHVTPRLTPAQHTRMVSE